MFDKASRWFAALGFAAASTLLTAAQAQAQDYPARPVRWVVGYPAGGGTDFLARTAGAQLSQNLGQPVMVDNRPGAGAIIASENVARSPGDGYTVFTADNGVLVYNPALYKKLPYDAEKDFAMLGLMGRSPLIITAAPTAGLIDAKALLAALKASPGKYSIATPGTGSPHHLAYELFQREAGVSMQHVPYKGGAPALQDLMGGQVQFMFDGMGTSLPMIKAGKLRALAVTSAQRLPFLPDVPTLAEQGYPDLTQIMGTSVWSTPDVPQDIRRKFRDELLKAMATPEVKSQLQVLGMQAGNPNQSVDDLEKQLRRDNERTGKILRSINYTP